MQVSIISPVSMLEEVPQAQHLILAHLMRIPAYKDFYKEQTGTYKVLDNGAAEDHLISDPKSLFETAEEIQADEIVVPDVMASAEGTINLARDFAITARQHPEYKYMGVVQGHDLAQVLKCLTALSHLEYISVLGLPRSLTRIHRLQRYYLAEQIPGLGMEDRWQEVHCLGSSMWMREVVVLAELPWIRSIDTSFPVVMALNNKDIAWTTKYIPRPTRYFSLEPTNEKMVQKNIQTYREWAAEGSEFERD